MRQEKRGRENETTTSKAVVCCGHSPGYKVVWTTLGHLLCPALVTRLNCACEKKTFFVVTVFEEMLKKAKNIHLIIDEGSKSSGNY